MAIKNVPNKSSGTSDNILYLHARVQTGESKARIDDLDGKVDSFKVSLEDLPNFPKLPTKFTLDECQVVYDADNEKVLAINPYVGVFLAIGRELGPRPDGEDGDPKARVSEPKKGNDGKDYTTKNFHEIFEIVDENSIFYGCKPRMFLQDKFVDDGNGMAGYSGTDKSKWTVRLSRFGSTQGLFDEDITWPKDGNVLPELEKRILNNERHVQLVFEGGFINTLLPVQPKVRRPVEELKAELAGNPSSNQKAEMESNDYHAKKLEDDVDAEFQKPAKKVAKKVEPDDEEL